MKNNNICAIVNTYLSSWELAAIRDFNVLSANGHPETLKRKPDVKYFTEPKHLFLSKTANSRQSMIYIS